MNRKIFLLCACFVAIVSANVRAQNALPAPSENLKIVRFPDLEKSAIDKREQIVAFQNFLVEIAAAKPLDPKILGAAYGTLGQIYQAYSFDESAEVCYHNAAQLAPQDFRWNYFLGALNRDRKKFNEAIYYFGKAKDLKSDYLPVFVNLGDAYLNINLPGAARENFEKALKIQSENPAALDGLGRTALAEEKYAEAAEIFERVLKLAPQAGRVRRDLATAYRALKKFGAADAQAATQGTDAPKLSDPLIDNLQELKKGIRLQLLRAKTALELGRVAEAENEFRKALVAEPENVAALVNYGAVLMQSKKFADAAKSFEKALQINPQNTGARYNLAVLYALDKNHLAAIGQLKKILQIAPQDGESRLLLAKELREADLLQESLNELILLYNADADNEEVVSELVKLLYRRKDFAQAKGILEKNYAKFPSRLSIGALLAFFYAAAQQKDLRDGKKALEIARSVYEKTNLIEHGAIVAMAYAELGQCDRAVKLANELLEQAVKAGNEITVAKLKNEIREYQSNPNCQTKK